MPRPPVVAISSTAEIIRGSLRVRLNSAYVRAVEQAGALPLVVPPLAQLAHVGALLDRADALLLTGGEDVDPAHYGAEPHPALGELNRERDATELALVTAAHERSLPTLAVCRGVQLLNVALGGTLIQDVPSERPSDVPHDSDGERSRRVHEVRVAAGSRLAQRAGSDRAAREFISPSGGGSDRSVAASDRVVVRRTDRRAWRRVTTPGGCSACSGTRRR